MSAPNHPLPAGLWLFVYGTLKRGHRNHTAHCPGLLTALEAEVWGRLYDLPYGYPMLSVPEETIVGQAQGDPSADLGQQQLLAAQVWPPPRAEVLQSSGWQRVQGEILVLADAAACLPALDRLENFSAGRPSLYHRVLVVPHAPRLPPIWTYAAPGGRLPQGAVLRSPVWP